MGLIYLDTCLVNYAVENHPEFSLPVLSAMAGVNRHCSLTRISTLPASKTDQGSKAFRD
jgi:hypothetical protein